MLPFQGAGPPPGPAPAVHDTVYAIARGAAYHRSLSETLIDRMWNEVGRALAYIFDFLRGSQTGRHVTVGLVALIVVALIVHLILVALARQDAPAAPSSHSARERAADAWREAERLSAAGRFTEASHALLAALLAAFAQRGEVRLHASKTAGDYARELARRGSPSRPAFQQFRRRYDEVIFGTGECSAGDYAALLRDAQPIFTRLGAA